uniref:(northern house mosquito) hypothetical protein n=1 Tax=Culex pipiens TaxID=7175 RepID=A0A8D8E070_CULPI
MYFLNFRKPLLVHHLHFPGQEVQLAVGRPNRLGRSGVHKEAHLVAFPMGLLPLVGHGNALVFACKNLEHIRRGQVFRAENPPERGTLSEGRSIFQRDQFELVRFNGQGLFAVD